MKKIIDFLSSPVFQIVVGFIFYYFLCVCVWNYDSFDRSSAGYGALLTVSFYAFASGFFDLIERLISKKKSDQDLDGQK